jgi:Leucine-rich repeat (LRR) protein
MKITQTNRLSLRQIKPTPLLIILFLILTFCLPEFSLHKLIFASDSEIVNKERFVVKDKPSTRVLKLDNSTTSDSELAEIVANNPDLVELTLGGTKITDAGIEHIAQLKKLRKIRLSKTTISNAAGTKLAKIPTLQDIDVSQTEFGDAGLESLKPLAKIKRLNLYLTKVTDAGTAKFKDFNSAKIITWLNLDLCQITDNGTKYLIEIENLEWLHLGGTDITNASLDNMTKFKKLNTIIVTKTSITKSAAEKLRKNMPNCKILDNVSENISEEQIKQAKKIRQR